VGLLKDADVASAGKLKADLDDTFVKLPQFASRPALHS
jgi:hypothetical protein